jgi:hypothetical protein
MRSPMRDFDLFDDDLAQSNHIDDKIFKRDCLELDLLIGGVPMTLYVVHFKSMGGRARGWTGARYTMPVRRAEARAVRRIIENKFGVEHRPTRCSSSAAT